MGIEYYLVKPDKKERFCLGKGYWSNMFYPPKWDMDDNGDWGHQPQYMRRKDLSPYEEWVTDRICNECLYYLMNYDKTEEEMQDTLLYIQAVARKIYDWMGDDVFYFTDDQSDEELVYQAKQTGSRYKNDEGGFNDNE